MKQENDSLLKFCRYYHGESECKLKDSQQCALWLYERAWVNSMKTEDETLSRYLDEYIDRGLTSFCETDNVPVTLKALLFNRYVSTAEMTDVNAFKKWYKDNYSH